MLKTKTNRIWPLATSALFGFLLAVLIFLPEAYSKNRSIYRILKDKIVVVSCHLTYEMYKKANKIGVKGIICSAIDYETLSKILGHPLGVAITGMEDTATIIVTEGFGEISMAAKTFNLLNKNNGLFASINGATQIRAGVMRPEIFIKSRDESSNAELFDEESNRPSAGGARRKLAS